MKSTRSKKNQLKDLSVQPLYDEPLLVVYERLNKITVDTVLTSNGNTIDIVFLATEENTILKYMLLNSTTTSSATMLPVSCLLEEIEILKRENNNNLKSFDTINNLKILEKTDTNNLTNSRRDLLIATNSKFIRMPVADCELKNNYFSCVSTMNPYCVWDSKIQKCALIYKTNIFESSLYSKEKNHQYHQNIINGCPTILNPGKSKNIS
jgi:hypothetical protein